jgi:hypothetical protein
MKAVAKGAKGRLRSEDACCSPPPICPNSK